MEGFVQTSRDLYDNWIWRDAKHLKWFMDLVYRASWQDRVTEIQGRRVELKRGQQIVSVRLLQKRWADKNEFDELSNIPARKTIERFLSRLEEHSIVKRDKNDHQFTILTICKYALCGIEVGAEVATPVATPVATMGDNKEYRNKEIREEGNKEINKETVSDDTVKKVPDRNLKFDKAAELWNEICGDVLPKVLKLTDTRRKKILARAAESKCKTMDEWTAWLTDYFKKLRASDFACKGTWCSFDWAFDNGNNWVKTMEGNYDNKETAQDTRHMTIQERVMAEHPNMKLNEAAYEHIAKDGRRTYGSSETKTVPYDAPPRPNNFYVWCEPTQEWVANY